MVGDLIEVLKDSGIKVARPAKAAKFCLIGFDFITVPT